MHVRFEKAEPVTLTVARAGGPIRHKSLLACCAVSSEPGLLLLADLDTKHSQLQAIIGGSKAYQTNWHMDKPSKKWARPTALADAPHDFTDHRSCLRGPCEMCITLCGPACS